MTDGRLFIIFHIHSPARTIVCIRKAGIYRARGFDDLQSTEDKIGIVVFIFLLAYPLDAWMNAVRRSTPDTNSTVVALL